MASNDQAGHRPARGGVVGEGSAESTAVRSAPSSSTNSKRDFPPHPAADPSAKAWWRTPIILAEKSAIHAFTLVELMITVIIVALLASFTIPSLLKTIERSRVEDAQEILLALYQAERYYFLDYTAPAGGGRYGTLDELVENNYITHPDPDENPNPSWDFSIKLTAAATKFNIRATRDGGGQYDNQTIAIDNAFTGDPNPLYGGKVFTIKTGTTGHELRD